MSMHSKCIVQVFELVFKVMSRVVTPCHVYNVATKSLVVVGGILTPDAAIGIMAGAG